MYETYRRFWHWLQTIFIVILLFTDLIIHRPDIFGVFSFHGMVMIHNVIATTQPHWAANTNPVIPIRKSMRLSNSKPRLNANSNAIRAAAVADK